jgi:hypothetical protein
VSERAGYREAMDRMTKQLRDSGVPADKARKVAQDTARRTDETQRDKGK